MADPLLAHVSRILMDGDWATSWQAIEILTEQFDGARPRIWWCNKWGTSDASPAGKTMCDSPEGRHKAEKSGCGWYFLYPDTKK